MVVGYIGIHRPHQWRIDTDTHRGKDNDGYHYPDIRWIHRDEEEDNRKYQTECCSPEECHALAAYQTGEPRRYTTENHTGYFTKRHENGIVDNQSLDGYIAMQTVIKHIAGYGITESVEEIGAHGDGCHIEPSLVVNEVGKLLERELLSALRLQTFLGKESASQCHHSSNNTEHGTNDSILMGSRTTYHLLEIWKREQGNESHGISTHHTERRELVLLIIIIGHHTEQ